VPTDPIRHADLDRDHPKIGVPHPSGLTDPIRHADLDRDHPKIGVPRPEPCPEWAVTIMTATLTPCDGQDRADR